MSKWYEAFSNVLKFYEVLFLCAMTKCYEVSLFFRYSTTIFTYILHYTTYSSHSSYVRYGVLQSSVFYVQWRSAMKCLSSFDILPLFLTHTPSYTTYMPQFYFSLFLAPSCIFQFLFTSSKTSSMLHELIPPSSFSLTPKSSRHISLSLSALPLTPSYLCRPKVKSYCKELISSIGKLCNALLYSLTLTLYGNQY